MPGIWATRYDNRFGRSQSRGRVAALSVLRRTAPGALGPGWLTAGATLARERPAAAGLRWRSRGLSLSYAVNVGEDWSGSVRLGLSEARFEKADAAFLVRRQDRTRSLGLTLSHRRVAWEGYQPVLTLDGSRTDSTIPLYDRTLLQVRVGLHRLF